MANTTPEPPSEDVEEVDFEEGLEPGADTEGESEGEGEDGSDFDGNDGHLLENHPHQQSDALIPQEQPGNEISNDESLSSNPTPSDPIVPTITIVAPSCSATSTLTPSPTPFLPSWSMQQKLDAAVEMNQRLLEENRSLAARLDSAEAHCTLALVEMDDLQKKLNSSKKKKKEGTLNIGARGLTSAAGLRAWEAEKAAHAEKERQKAEAAQQREARETVAQAARDARGPTMAFSGALSSKSKADLLELSQALGTSLDSARNNPERVALIQTHLDGHPQLKDDPKFAGLYSRVTRGQKRTHTTCTMDENTAPADSLERSAVRRRLNDSESSTGWPASPFATPIPNERVPSRGYQHQPFTPKDNLPGAHY
ncbi:hypothetical protein M405DRAFT_922894 [Rhizopogon salebrosus TDB-379]|nr:hypothetical protein M405DRAFT_922894 [Rhizopogon salebrosus TDB-379]